MQVSKALIAFGATHGKYDIRKKNSSSNTFSKKNLNKYWETYEENLFEVLIDSAVLSSVCIFNQPVVAKI